MRIGVGLISAKNPCGEKSINFIVRVSSSSFILFSKSGEYTRIIINKSLDVHILPEEKIILEKQEAIYTYFQLFENEFIIKTSKGRNLKLVVP